MGHVEGQMVRQSVNVTLAESANSYPILTSEVEE